ncbi:MAG TPA: M15 family metallopeptidase, partial [Burkholderiaceae bacterium]
SGGAGLGRLVPKPAAGTINQGLVAANNALMLAAFGQPLAAGTYTSQCQVPTNPTLRRNLVTDTVGPFKVTGLLPAVLSLKEVMADIQSAQPQVHAALGTAGMLCCRLVRGSATSVSNHSWGTAIDLTLDGVLDERGDDLVQFGLTLIAPIFNRHGWYWGAGFATEDGMHFEGSAAKIGEWKTQLR